MARRRRPLRPDEEDLWQTVARSARPLRPAKLRLPDTNRAAEPPLSPAPQPPVEPPRPIPAFRIGEARSTTATTSPRPPSEPPLRMDAKAFGRLSRGKITPEARIDLHGMTLAEAQPELTRFILDAHARGRRLILVITGKGRPAEDVGPIPLRTGVLKQQLPLWLSREPLRSVVLQCVEAHVRHGGGGAFYVYLRRPR